MTKHMCPAFVVSVTCTIQWLYGFLLPHNFPDEALVTKNITIKFSYRYKILQKCKICYI